LQHFHCRGAGVKASETEEAQVSLKETHTEIILDGEQREEIRTQAKKKPSARHVSL